MNPEQDLTQAVDDRLARLVELSRLRAQTRTAMRKRLKARRDVGLQRRHEQKISRQESDQ